MVIDLQKLLPSVTDFIIFSLSNFESSNEGEKICTLCLCGDGFHGSVFLYLDTLKNSMQTVAKWEHKGSAWYGEDKIGKFNNSGADFAHYAGDFVLPDYPDFYEVDPETIEFVQLDGEVIKPNSDEGNEGLNKIIFSLLKQAVIQLSPFDSIPKAQPFRVGVQMIDSKYIEYWVPK